MCVGMGLIAILSHTDQMKLVAKLTKKELGDRSTFGCSSLCQLFGLLLATRVINIIMLPDCCCEITYDGSKVVG